MSAIQDQLADLCTRFGVEALYAFGSRAKEAKRVIEDNIPLDTSFRSDLDIGVKPAGQVKLLVNDKVKLALELEDLFQISRVDLVVITEVGPFLALDIVKGELLYSSDDDTQAEYELLVLRRAGDLAHYAHERWNQILGIT